MAAKTSKSFDCPTCGRRFSYERVADIESFPFCSRRCRLLDLDKWLDGEYRIPREATGDDFQDEENFNMPDTREKP